VWLILIASRSLFPNPFIRPPPAEREKQGTPMTRDPEGTGRHELQWLLQDACVKTIGQGNLVFPLSLLPRSSGIPLIVSTRPPSMTLLFDTSCVTLLFYPWHISPLLCNVHLPGFLWTLCVTSPLSILPPTSQLNYPRERTIALTIFFQRSAKLLPTRYFCFCEASFSESNFYLSLFPPVFHLPIRRLFKFNTGCLQRPFVLENEALFISLTPGCIYPQKGFGLLFPGGCGEGAPYNPHRLLGLSFPSSSKSFPILAPLTEGRMWTPPFFEMITRSDE